MTAKDLKRIVGAFPGFSVWDFSINLPLPGDRCDD
jgi:hypothetical protein